MSNLAVLVRADLVSEIIIRSQGKADVGSMIEHAIETFLDRTRGDSSIWSEEHAQTVASEEEDDILTKVGHPSKGYRWHSLMLPNGTALKISYKGQEKVAEVRHQQIYYQGTPCSPSQFASRVANNTSRNAWRDIWIKRPSDRNWVFADTLRMANT